MTAQDVALALGPLLLRPGDTAAARGASWKTWFWFLKNTFCCSGFPGCAVEAVEALVTQWQLVADALSQRERAEESPRSDQV